MKTKLTTALLAATGAALVVQSASVGVTYNNTDLLLGIRAYQGTGASQDYVVDLGLASQFVHPSSSAFTLSLGNIQADLAAQFGANWLTSGNLRWSVSGVDRNARDTMWATRANPHMGAPTAGWNDPNGHDQASIPAGELAQMAGNPGGTGFSSYSATANSSVAVLQGAGDINSYGSFKTAGTPGNVTFDYFNQGIENVLASGVGSDLWEVDTAQSIGVQGNFLGYFSWDGSGNLAFAVPEPSALSLGLLGGAGLLGLSLRRRPAAHS